MIERATAVAGGLFVAGVVCVVVGVRTESARSDAVRPRTTVSSSDTTPAATPVLSARRAPDLLVKPQAARRLATKLTPLMATAPAQTCVVVADGASTLFAAQPDVPMPAASNQKILTALTALDVLGADSTFTTRFAATSAPSGGVVNGDLWMIGGGDPVIDSDTYQSTLKYGRTPHTRIEDVADKIVASGITTITGSVRGDESRYDTVRTVPSWPDRYVQQNQVGPLTALSVNDARTYAVVGGASTGSARPAADPPAYAADALTQLLVARGVTVGGPPGSGTAPDGLVTVAEVESLPAP